MRRELLQLTLAVLKPHVLQHPFAVSSIKNRILDANFKVVRSKQFIFDNALAERFYEEHKNKFFYNRLITFICSGPAEAYILTSKNAIAEWRALMGPTKVYKAQYTDPDSIRGTFGLSDTRNAAHGSDSPESVKREIRILYPDFSIDQWYELEEPFFAAGRIKYLADKFLHVIIDKGTSLKNIHDNNL